MFSIFQVASPRMAIEQPSRNPELPYVGEVPLKGRNDWGDDVTVTLLCKVARYPEAEAIGKALSMGVPLRGETATPRLYVIGQGTKHDAWLSFYNGQPCVLRSHAALRCRRALAQVAK